MRDEPRIQKMKGADGTYVNMSRRVKRTSYSISSTRRGREEGYVTRTHFLEVSLVMISVSGACGVTLGNLSNGTSRIGRRRMSVFIKMWSM